MNQPNEESVLAEEGIRVGKEHLEKVEEKTTLLYETLVRISLLPNLPDAEKIKLEVMIKQYNYLLICMLYTRSMNTGCQKVY